MLIKLQEGKIKTNPTKSVLQKISRGGKFFLLDGVKIKYARQKNDHLNLCIAVSKKISKSAVDRNYIKRYIRSEFIKFVKDTSIENYSFYIIVLKKEICNNFGEKFLEAFTKIKDQ